MNWYYAEGNQQKGPVSEAEIDQLFQRGQITGATLIWKEGMANWEAYSSVRSAAAASGTGPGLADGSVVCSQCGQIFGANDVIRYGDKAVCAACKPVFLQKLREGASISATDLDYVGFWWRALAKIVDGIILQIINGIITYAGFMMAGMGARGSEPNFAVIGLTYAINLIVQLFYYTFFVGAYGATPGKMACKIRIVNADGSKVSYQKAMGRCLAEILSFVTCFIGYLMAAFDDEKRALHDRICDTRVIRN
jgi:uncharacterized RDD family membrane protein YckC